jgi:hypothetical protein
MYANKKVAMENEMKDAEEKIEEIKQEKELVFVSGRRTHLEKPGRSNKMRGKLNKCRL